MRCCGQATDGFLNVNKPAGKTSFGVVAQVRRLTGVKRVGHAGTLDPLATGALPVCLGQATRLVEYLSDSTKTYLAGIELGVTTDTYDAEGSVLQRMDCSGVTREQVDTALATFLGQTTQTPPRYSAIKLKGRPSYKLARAGIDATPAPRTITIHRILLLDWQPPIVTAEIECARGTYIRSLAQDLGQKLGCGAYLKSLVRTRDSIFNLEDAVTLDQLTEAVNAGYWESLLYPMDSILSHWPAAVVGGDKEKAVRNGVSVALETGGTLARAYSQDGCLLSVLRYDAVTALWHPEKVFGAGGCPHATSCGGQGQKPCEQAGAPGADSPSTPAPGQTA